MEKKEYKANIEIIREGQDGTHMYILEKGSVTVTKVIILYLSIKNSQTNSAKKCFKKNEKISAVFLTNYTSDHSNNFSKIKARIALFFDLAIFLFKK